MRSGTKFLFSSLLFFAFIFLTFHLVLPLTLPFLLGLGLALAAEPSVSLLCRRLHLPRGLSAGISVSCAFLLLSMVLTGILAVLFRGIRALGLILPDLEEAAVSGLTLLEQWLLQLARKAPQSLRPVAAQHVLDLFSDSTAFLQESTKFVLSFAGSILTQVPDRAFTLFTAIISGFMISAKLPKLKASVKEQLSRKNFKAILSFLKNFRNTLGRWLLAQLKLTCVTLLILMLGFIVLKIPYAPIWAAAVAFLDALPILGTGAVLIPWSIISFLRADTVKALGLLALYICAMATRSVLEPRLIGRQLGLDPLLTLAAIYAGYRLWGFGGMILSPLLAVTAFRLIPQARNSGKSL